MSGLTMRGMKIRVISLRGANRTACKRPGKEKPAPAEEFVDQPIDDIDNPE